MRVLVVAQRSSLVNCHFSKTVVQLQFQLNFISYSI